MYYNDFTKRLLKTLHFDAGLVLLSFDVFHLFTKKDRNNLFCIILISLSPTALLTWVPANVVLYLLLSVFVGTHCLVNRVIASQNHTTRIR